MLQFTMFLVLSLLINTDCYNQYEMLNNAYVDYTHTIEVVSKLGYEAELNPLSRRLMKITKTKQNWLIMRDIYLIGLSQLIRLPKPYNNIIIYAVDFGHFICGYYSGVYSSSYPFVGNFKLTLFYVEF